MASMSSTEEEAKLAKEAAKTKLMLRAANKSRGKTGKAMQIVPAVHLAEAERGAIPAGACTALAVRYPWSKHRGRDGSDLYYNRATCFVID